MRSTAPLTASPSLTIRTLDVEVIEGDDEGKRLNGGDLVTIGTAPGNDLQLTDQSVSGYHLEISCGERGIDLQDLGSTNGTYLGGAALHKATVPAGSVLKIGRTKLRLTDGQKATVELHLGSGLEGLLGSTPVMRRLMAQLRRAAKSPVPSLLIGESGTGKEVVAQAYHKLSERSQAPFVTVDCGAVSANLLASELFGHERGAFTGAHARHVGAFERADKGTLFLDEIGELPLDLQPQLLGALERRRFRRLGGQQEVEVDVQVLCATNRDLRQEVNHGSFRLDLYYRVAALVLKLPPLRERRNDIPLLVEHFLRECGHAGDIKEIVTDEVMEALTKHRWPGNVRELRNWVEVTVALGEAGELGPEGAPTSTSSLDRDGLLELPYKEARNKLLADFELSYLTRLLEKAEGNVSRAAREARMDRTYLIKLLQRHDLK